MRIVLLGPPGSGKGTQANTIVKAFEVPHISTGDMFRAALKEGTDLGIQAKAFMEAGNLVPDSLTVQIVKERLQKADCVKGFLLDGFPRTLVQAAALDTMLEELSTNLDTVVNIEVVIEDLITRLTGRLICRQCQTPYHKVFLPPKQSGVCDVCGGELYQRADDSVDTVMARLEVYDRQTSPLISYYANSNRLLTINGNGTVDEVGQRILAALEKLS